MNNIYKNKCNKAYRSVTKCNKMLQCIKQIGHCNMMLQQCYS
jgi:hypothetical protein